MTLNEIRILKAPTQKNCHVMVSMPKTAWFWLDNFVEQRHPDGGYRALLHSFQKAGQGENLSKALLLKAQEHCEEQMAGLYNLSNDNKACGKPVQFKVAPEAVTGDDLQSRMPFGYWLFHFLPHATYLTTVWERRNYHLRRVIKD